jgi:hypothetical protein
MFLFPLYPLSVSVKDNCNPCTRLFASPHIHNLLWCVVITSCDIAMLRIILSGVSRAQE